jgi:hypothetical protein
MHPLQRLCMGLSICGFVTALAHAETPMREFYVGAPPYQMYVQEWAAASGKLAGSSCDYDSWWSPYRIHMDYRTRRQARLGSTVRRTGLAGLRGGLAWRGSLRLLA